MRLTDQEQRLLNGEEGEIKALAMSYLVKLGNAFDGEEMVDIAPACFVCGNAERGNGASVVYVGRQCERLRSRIIVVAQETVRTRNLHVMDPRIPHQFRGGLRTGPS